MRIALGSPRLCVPALKPVERGLWRLPWIPKCFYLRAPSLRAEIKNPRVLRPAGWSLASLASFRKNRTGEIYGLLLVGPGDISTAFLRVTSAMTMCIHP